MKDIRERFEEIPLSLEMKKYRLGKYVKMIEAGSDENEIFTKLNYSIEEMYVYHQLYLISNIVKESKDAIEPLE